MNFLYPLGLLFSIFLPLVVILYLLKLKRTDQVISSTLLWRRSLEDLKANSPFQKLRRNLLLLLQLIIIAILTLAVARPVLELGGLEGQSFVVLIDHSASMNASDVKPSRLEDAKEKALKLVEDMGKDDRMMIVSFSSRAHVLCPFEERKGALRDVIRGIRPTESPTNIDEALKVAKSTLEVQQNVELVILSDGRFELPVDSLGAMTVRYVPIGSDSENVGIVDLVVRRDYALQQNFEVLVGVQNCGLQAQDVYVELYGQGNIYDSPVSATSTAGTVSGGAGGEDRNLLDAQRLDLAAGASEQIIFANPGYFPEKIEVVLDSKDALVTDNRAWALIPQTRQMDLLLVTSGNVYLERALALDPHLSISKVAPGAYISADGYDLVVFDNFSPPAIAGGNYFFINTVPPLPDWSAGETVELPMVVDWDELHPLTRYINLDNLIIKETRNIGTPAWAEKIMEARETPLVVAAQQDRLRIIVTAFDIYDSNWPLLVSFPIFFTNALNWISANKDASAFVKRTGDIIILEPPADLTLPAEMIAPDGSRHALSFPENRPVYFGETRNTGIYEYRVGGQLKEAYAVNLISPQESTITPATTLQTSTTEITGDPTGLASNREIWRTLAILAFLILCLEWYIYIKRARYAF